jgi:hypothetical protein
MFFVPLSCAEAAAVMRKNEQIARATAERLDECLRGAFDAVFMNVMGKLRTERCTTRETRLRSDNHYHVSHRELRWRHKSI